MSDQPEFLFLLFTTSKSDELCERVNEALTDFERRFEFKIFEVTRQPEIAEHYRVLAVPTLIREDLQSSERTYLIGDSSKQDILQFARKPGEAVELRKQRIE